MKVRTVLIWEGLANAILALLKLFVGLSVNSTAILSDALHSLSDLANNGIALFVAKAAEEPPDRDHPYGHHKYEQIAVFALASLLTVVAFELILSALERFGTNPSQSALGLWLMLLALAVNLGIAVWEGYWAKKLQSDILRADARHTLSDALTTTVVIVGWQLAVLGFGWLDPLFALLVALLVLYLAFDLFRRSIPILVDSAGYDPRQLSAALQQLEGVRAVHRVRSRRYGNGVAADVVVLVDPALSTKESHTIADAIEGLLAQRFGIHDTTVHIEPDSGNAFCQC